MHPDRVQALPRRLLVTLYLVAGIPLGTFADVVPVYLRAEGLSLRDIGLFSLLHLPYSVKVLWGPLVDRYGQIQRWLWLTAFGLAASYACLARVGPQAHAVRFAWCCLLMTTSSAIFDVALDASFVRTLAGRGQAAEAQANALRLSAFKFAMVAVGSGALVVGGTFRFAWAFYAMLAAHAALLVTVPWAQLTQPAPQAPPPRLLPYFRGLAAWVRTPYVLRAFALVFCYKLSIAALLSLERAFWVDRGIRHATLGLIGALVGLGSTVAGAGAGSLLAHRRGLAAMLTVGVAVQVLAAAAYAVLTYAPASPVSLAVGLACSGGAFGLSTAALMSLITRLCRAPHAATQFAALTGTYALTRSAAGPLSGAVAERFGYVGLFVTAAGLGLPALWLLPRTLAAMPRRTVHGEVDVAAKLVAAEP